MKTKLASFVAGGALVFGGAALSFADTYTFPPGGGDLADLSAWQAGYPTLADLPGVDDSIRLGSSSRFILSKDLTVKEFTFNKKDAELDFAASGNHTLKVLGEAHAFCAHNGTVRGGVIDRNGQNMLWFQDDGFETTVTGGCVITNCNQFYVNVWGRSNGRLHLTGGSRLYAKSLVINRSTGVSSRPSGNTWLEVAGGAQVKTTDPNNHSYSDADTQWDSSGGNVFDIHGEGTSVEMAGNYVNGRHSNSNVLKVSDGALFTASKLYVGNSDVAKQLVTKGNRLTVVSGGTVRTTVSHIVAYGDGVVIALTNGTLSAVNGEGLCDFSAATNATVDIVDAVWRCADFKTAPGLRLHVSGQETVFSTSQTRFGMISGTVGSRVCLDNGFSWRPSISGGYYLMLATTNCALTVENGAAYSAFDSNQNADAILVFGGSAASNSAKGNVICAASDGEIRGREIWLTGVENRLVISNGLVSAAKDVSLGHGDWAGGNVAVLQGTAPRIRAKSCKVGHGTTLRFEIPEAGYAADSVPIVCTDGLSLVGDANAIEIDVSRFAPEMTTQLTLAQFGIDLSAEQQAWFRGAQLPERYRIEILDGRKVVLKARGRPRGTAVVFR